MPNDAAISLSAHLRHVYKKYGAFPNELQVLNDLSLDFTEGRITSILGPSGCGKTTILQILAGLEPTTSGVVEFTPPGLRRIGYVFQRDRLFPWRTVLQNAVFGLEIDDGKSTEGKLRAIQLLSDLGLAEFLNAYPNSLSEGMRQRVALCRALVFEPEVLLLDEPLSSLDLEARLTAEDFIRTYTRSNRVITIIVTHDLDEAIALADDLVLLTSRPAQIRMSWDLTFKSSIDSGIAIRSDPQFKAFVSDLVNQILGAHEHSS
jgi:NitT/TauT family transport system ATP-binding protein